MPNVYPSLFLFRSVYHLRHTTNSEGRKRRRRRPRKKKVIIIEDDDDSNAGRKKKNINKICYTEEEKKERTQAEQAGVKWKQKKYENTVFSVQVGNN